MAETIRLTNEARGEILASVLTEHFKVDEEQLAQLAVELGDAVYANAFTLPEHEHTTALPSYWFSTEETVHITCDGFRNKWDKDHSAPSRELPLSRARAVPVHVGGNFTIAKGHPLMLQAQTLVLATQRVHDARKKLRSQLHSLLASARTVAALEKIWPEGKRFYSSLTPKANMPLVDANLVADINKKLGI